MINPVPTRRAVLYPTYACPMKCSFCYEKYREVKEHKPFDTLCSEAENFLSRGVNYFDCSGGEPTIYPQMTDFVKYSLSRGAKTCLITSAISGEQRTRELLDSGVDDFLVSIHGLEKTHNELVGVPNARSLQIRFMNQVLEKFRFRMNCVITKNNQNEIVGIAKWMVQFKPRIVNFINFQPLATWKTHENECLDIISDLRILEPHLNEAIKILEDNDCGVNVRYYPMCRIKEEYRRCVCNKIAVPFDFYEWIYNMNPNDFNGCRQWGINLSKTEEEKGVPCCNCDLQWICGGINKQVNRVTGGSMVDPVLNTGIQDKNDFYFYRKHNVKTLTPKE